MRLGISRRHRHMIVLCGTFYENEGRVMLSSTGSKVGWKQSDTLLLVSGAGDAWVGTYVHWTSMSRKEEARVRISSSGKRRRRTTVL